MPRRDSQSQPFTFAFAERRTYRGASLMQMDQASLRDHTWPELRP